MITFYYILNSLRSFSNLHPHFPVCYWIVKVVICYCLVPVLYVWADQIHFHCFDKGRNSILKYSYDINTQIRYSSLSWTYLKLTLNSWLLVRAMLLSILWMVCGSPCGNHFSWHLHSLVNTLPIKTEMEKFYSNRKHTFPHQCLHLPNRIKPVHPNFYLWPKATFKGPISSHF